MMKFWKWPLAVLMAGVLFTGCDDDDDDDDPDPQPQEQSITATVQAEGDFSILADALTRTQLTGVLADENNDFTVFGPDNDAFQDLLNDLGLASLDELESTLGTNVLRNILLYHVVSGEVMANQVTTGYVSTQGVNDNGNNLSAYLNAESGVMINGTSTVEEADIEATNGVIHRVDAVIMPMTVAGLVAVNEMSLSSLEAALGVADGNLISVLSNENATYTVLAPNNAAFDATIAATNSGDLNGLVQFLGGTAELADVLLYHVLPTEVQSGSVSDTVNGANVTFSTANGVEITDGGGNTSSVIEADITGTNGVVHIIDGVLLP